MGDDVIKKPPVIAVCGVKNSGKTTLLVHLIKAMTERGYKTAVIKHDGHDFDCDVPGTDSFRLHRAGAYGTAVFSENRIFVHKELRKGAEDQINPEQFVQCFPEADLIFAEGLKNTALPKIEVIRRAVSKAPASNPKGRFLIVTDWGEEQFDEPTAPLSSPEKTVEYILKHFPEISQVSDAFWQAEKKA